MRTVNHFPHGTGPGMRRVFLGALLWLLAANDSAVAQTPLAAEISLRRADGQPLTSVELGESVELEVVIDAGDEELTGFSFYLAYDPAVFRVLPPIAGGGAQTTVTEPFAAGDWLNGVVLLNRLDNEDGEGYLSYAEAAGVQRGTGVGTGVAATFRVEATRRPLGDLSELAIIERGQNRVSHYTTVEAPGAERLFGHPLSVASVRITGFRIRSLPDTTIVEGDGVQVVYEDLGAFVEQEGAQVIWTSSFIRGLGTVIDAAGRVTMAPEGIVGDTTVLFTAFEVGEGNEASDEVKLHILSRPRVVGLPPTVTFHEDDASPPVNLDDFVIDLDDDLDSLSWASRSESFVRVDIDPGTRQAVFSAAPDSFGEASIRLVVSDTDGLTDTVTVQVIVLPVNDPPEAQRRPPVYPRLGVAGEVVVPLSELISDADDIPDSLQIVLQSEGAVSARLSDDGQAVVVSGEQTGRGIVRLTAEDRAGELTVGRLVAVVLPEGTTLAPKIAPLPVLRFREGLPGTLDLNTLVDDDSPVGGLQWTAASIGELNPVVLDGVLLVTGRPGFVGPAGIGLTVTDPDGNQDSASLAVEVLGSGQSHAPRIWAPPKVGLTSAAGSDHREVTLNLDPLVDDADDDDEDLTWIVTASQGLTAHLDADTRRVTLSAASGLNEIAALTLTVTDGDGLADTRSIPVLIVDADSAPLISELAEVVLDSSAAVGRVDLDDVVFDDEDLESELAWSAIGEPGIDIDYDPVTHLLRVRRNELEDGPTPPSVARVVLTVTDTRGQERSAILRVALPPVFQLQPISELPLFAGGQDSSLVLADQVVPLDSAPSLVWAVDEPKQLAVRIDSSTRVHVHSPNVTFIGTEILRFTATDETGRSRAALVRVRVKGLGLAPQIRALPTVVVRAGEEDRSLDLDDFVVDDDADSNLVWSVSSPPDVEVLVDELNHELTVRPQSLAAGPRTAQLLVVDPAGNTALGFLEIQVLRGGEPPVIGTLPQILLPAGGPEQALSLDLFVTDNDTPDADILWRASTEPGVSARIDGRRLLVAVPAGQQGTRRVVLSAVDPQGNVDEAILTVLIQQDDEAPSFALEAKRNDLVSGRLDITIRPSETLLGAPTVLLNGAAAEVIEGADGTWEAAYPVPQLDDDQRLTIEVTGRDRAGNEGQRNAEIALRRVAQRGGSVATADGRASLNVPAAVARPGRVAVLYPLASQDLPETAGAAGAYSVDVAGGAELEAPVTISLFAGSGASDPTRGIERWNPATGQWDDVPATADEASGVLSAAVRESGIYRLGTVTADNRRPATQLSNYPNPFNAGGGAATRIEYEVRTGGPVLLEVYNTLGQRVRVLVHEGFQDVGLWSVDWDGRDTGGRRLGSGVYVYQLTESGVPRMQRLLLLR